MDDLQYQEVHLPERIRRQPKSRLDRFLLSLQRVVFVVGAMFILWQLGVYSYQHLPGLIELVAKRVQPKEAKAAAVKGYFFYRPAAGPQAPTSGKIVMLNRMSPGPFERLRVRDRLRAVTSLHLHSTDDLAGDFAVVEAESCLVVVAKPRPAVAKYGRPKVAGAGWLYLQVIPCPR